MVSILISWKSIEKRGCGCDYCGKVPRLPFEAYHLHLDFHVRIMAVSELGNFIISEYTFKAITNLGSRASCPFGSALQPIPFLIPRSIRLISGMAYGTIRPR